MRAASGGRRGGGIGSYTRAVGDAGVHRRIGLLGGTFDPPHNGHLVAAAWACSDLELDEVRFVVAHRPWQKVGKRVLTDPPTRLALVEAAVAGIDRLVPCAIEIERGGDSYMVDTLIELRAAEPDTTFHVILGADAAAGLMTWHRWEELPALARLVVVDRPGSPRPAVPTSFELDRVEIPQLDISSTSVRHRVAASQPVAGLVPLAVSSLIGDLGLYREGAHGRPSAH